MLERTSKFPYGNLREILSVIWLSTEKGVVPGLPHSVAREDNAQILYPGYPYGLMNLDAFELWLGYGV